MVPVVTAAQSVAREQAAVASGVASWRLMQAAGTAAASVICARYPDRLQSTVVYAGAGNNGGDGWVCAAALMQRGDTLEVWSAGAPRSEDAQRARATYTGEVIEAGGIVPSSALVVDALLGTGANGSPRDAPALGISSVATQRAARAAVVALDVPSGVDATTGAALGSVIADCTLTFGTMKRGLLLQRGLSGVIVVLDIGLGDHVNLGDGAPMLASAAWVARQVPPIPAEAHKGVRRRIAVVGGARGMAGATILAARGAFATGVGMVRLIVAEESMDAVQCAAPQATAAPWPSDDASCRALLDGYAHAVLVGPGLGRQLQGSQLLDLLLRAWSGPLVLDADALYPFGGKAASLRERLSVRAAVLTPHASECAHLAGCTVDEVTQRRFELPGELARATGATVLLKGVPTVIGAPDGRTMVSAAGTPALATAGSGDVLAGIAVTLLAQGLEAFEAAACAAWAHGRAAEYANAGRPVRGVLLDDVVERLGDVWRFTDPPAAAPVLAELPAVGDRLPPSGPS